MRLIAIVVLALTLFAGCNTMSVTTEYGVNMAPNNHGLYVPTYNTKLIIKN